jgi:hypothetical protein
MPHWIAINKFEAVQEFVENAIQIWKEKSECNFTSKKALEESKSWINKFGAAVSTGGYRS